MLPKFLSPSFDCKSDADRQTGTMKTRSIAGAFAVLLAIMSSAITADGQTNTPAVVTHVQPKEAAELLKQGGVTVLDLRTPKEFKTGHIAGATNIDCQSDSFSTRLEKLDREKSYVIHCGSGYRSTNSIPEFENLGFKHIIHLDGGLKAWVRTKNPVVKD